MTRMIWVGLDVHKNSTTAAILEDEAREGDVVRLSADLNELRRLFRRLAARGTVRACYEASAVGFVVHRVLERDSLRGHRALPHPNPAGRSEEDRPPRRAGMARLPERTSHPVRVPDEEREAVDLSSAPASPFQAKKCKQRCPQPAPFPGPYSGTARATGRRSIVSGSLRYAGNSEGAIATRSRRRWAHRVPRDPDQKPRWRDRPLAGNHRPMVSAECLRGGALTAMTLATEIGDIRRFRSPRPHGLGRPVPVNPLRDRQQRGRSPRRAMPSPPRARRGGAQPSGEEPINLVLERRRQGQPTRSSASPSRHSTA
jgi:hypothetical protein